jgi:hypothetical protein
LLPEEIAHSRLRQRLPLHGDVRDAVPLQRCASSGSRHTAWAGKRPFRWQ